MAIDYAKNYQNYIDEELAAASATEWMAATSGQVRYGEGKEVISEAGKQIRRGWQQFIHRKTHVRVLFMCDFRLHIKGRSAEGVKARQFGGE